MSLLDYLELHQLSYHEFGRMVGVAGMSIWRYANGRRIPRPPIMLRIFDATDGAVGPEDFYSIYEGDL